MVSPTPNFLARTAYEQVVIDRKPEPRTPHEGTQRRQERTTVERAEYDGQAVRRRPR